MSLLHIYFTNTEFSLNSTDVNETFSCETETRQRRLKVCSIRDRDRDLSRPRRFSRCHKRYSLLSFWVQTATNYAAFRSFIMQYTVQYQQLFYTETVAPFSQRLLAI